MVLKRWFVLGILPFVILGCAGSQVSADQQNESAASENPAIETPANERRTDENATPLATNSSVAQASDSPEVVTVVKSGQFESGEHPTSGTVQLVEENGTLLLELDESFQTSSNGPDLVVILHRSDDVLGGTEPPAYPIEAGEYVILAPLQEFSGSQRYAIPDDINVEEYRSAAIWCRQFNATFGAAVLQ